MNNLLNMIGVHIAQIASLLQLIAGIWIALVATAALTTWRKQLRAEKQLSFIDELTNTIHEFILLMAAPTSRLAFAKIGIEAHKGAAFEFEQYENAEAIAFINKNGSGTSDKIVADLALLRPVLGRMQSLAAKGQVLGLEDYPKCHNACAMLAWSYDQLQAFCAIIGNPNLNWEHPLVQESLNNLSKIDADRINANLKKQHEEFIEFAKRAYGKAIR
jgi:hypothetical protein